MPQTRNNNIDKIIGVYFLEIFFMLLKIIALFKDIKRKKIMKVYEMAEP